jgi:hypothetical protein
MAPENGNLEREQTKRRRSLVGAKCDVEFQKIESASRSEISNEMQKPAP